MIELNGLTFEELKEYVVNMGEAPFRAKQIFEAVAKGADSIASVKGLSNSFKERLCENAVITRPEIAKKLVSKDGTIKYLFELS